MFDITKEQLERLKNKYPQGARVVLTRMEDPHAPELGTLGTVKDVDDTGSIMVDWDNGSSLSVLYKIDHVKKV